MDNSEVWQMLKEQGLLCERLIMQKESKNKSSCGKESKKRKPRKGAQPIKSMSKTVGSSCGNDTRTRKRGTQ